MGPGTADAPSRPCLRCVHAHTAADRLCLGSHMSRSPAHLLATSSTVRSGSNARNACLWSQLRRLRALLGVVCRAPLSPGVHGTFLTLPKYMLH